ncbi:MAG: hypothetical protein PHI97_00140 [Desulfobulbus sp.]|nr:hypothetical protein [Desulfobulbus sp.]
MNNVSSTTNCHKMTPFFSHLASVVLLLCLSTILVGCGAATGIPGHGGGKRFAVEQELVAAATRAAIKQIDLTTLKGKKVNLYVNAIGDTGAGNLTGGRFSIVSQLRGDYTQTAPVTETSLYPRYTANTTSTTTTDSSTSNTSQSTDTINQYPYYKKTTQEGTGAVGQLGVEYKGLGAYHNSEEITSNDLQYLSALMQTYFFLQGVYIVPPSEAEIDVYITVDVFGTVYTRVDWFLANNEILRAKTSLEVLAVDHYSGELLMEPQVASSEATYNEQYILWAGPVNIRKSLKTADPLLADFTNIIKSTKKTQPIYKVEHAPYPFQYQMEH